jgi:hypothetical protein
VSKFSSTISYSKIYFKSERFLRVNELYHCCVSICHVYYFSRIALPLISTLPNPSYSPVLFRKVTVSKFWLYILMFKIYFKSERCLRVNKFYNINKYKNILSFIVKFSN